MFVVRYNSNLCEFGIREQISCRCKIGIHAHRFGKSLCQREREESDSGVQIQRHVAARVCHNRLQQVLNQEAIYLKKGKMADAILIPARFLHQMAGAAQLKFVLLLIQEQQAFHLRQGVAKNRG